MTNNEESSYRLDIINNNECKSFYFNTYKEVKNFQKFQINLNKYKEFI